MRFVRRKMEFVDAIGQSVAESVDEGARFFGNTDASIADVEMSGAEP